MIVFVWIFLVVFVVAVSFRFLVFVLILVRQVFFREGDGESLYFVLTASHTFGPKQIPLLSEEVTSKRS